MNNEHCLNNMDEDLRKQVQDRRRMLQESDPEMITETGGKHVQDRRETLQETQDPDKLRHSTELQRKTHKRSTCLLSFATILLSSLMIYVGVRYRYCEDLFSPWLITGGVLNMLDVIFLFLAFRTCKTVSCIAYGISFAIFIWWIFGVSRIFSGSIFKEQIHIENNGICKWYMFWIPFWLSLLPFLIIAVIFCSWCFEDCCCENNED